MLSRRVIAYYGLIRASEFLPATYGFRGGACCTQGNRLGVGIQRFPNLLRWTVLACRLPYPGGPQRVHMTVASSWVLAFTSKLRVRRPHWSFRGCRVHFKLRPASWLALLSRTFTFELAPARSPQTSVEYDYVGKQSIPTTGLSPASPTALWAAVPDLTPWTGSDPLDCWRPRKLVIVGLKK